MKTQKTTEKKQTSKKAVNCEDTNTCKCDTANTLLNDLKQQYSKIATENDVFKSDINRLNVEIEKRDNIIRALQKNVDFYRNRTVWQTIKTHWFGR